MKCRLAEIENDIFKEAKKYLLDELSEYVPKILPSLPVNPTSSKFPLIIIEQINDITIEKTLKNGESKLRLVFEIEIFAKDTTINQTIIAKKDVISSIKSKVNNFFEEMRGFERTASNPRQNIDLDVVRHYMRYECVYDTVNKKIYRR